MSVAKAAHLRGQSWPRWRRMALWASSMLNGTPGSAQVHSVSAATVVARCRTRGGRARADGSSESAGQAHPRATTANPDRTTVTTIVDSVFQTLISR
ncbi:hypothetical protein [Nocardia brevicatena]|uniref:hypothetical protein n=1 Tax=Nocardia brevicatena TaxID=37327 RepID=UPI0012F759FA|nr:hypothetical protein [Nocardia brevicatena]